MDIGEVPVSTETTLEFVYQANPVRVLFGAGTLSQIPAEADRLGLRRIAVLATPPQQTEAQALAERLGERCAGVFSRAVMHTPVEVTEQALGAVTEWNADGLVAVGGGSTTGLSKAIALRTDLPQIVVPTTYAGSEMTPILGETKDGVKVTQVSPRVLPEVIIYDVNLTLTLPAALSATSGINAVAHAVEALYARDRNPIVSLMALEGIAKLTGALPVIAADPMNKDARSDALYGAMLCGACLGSVGMAFHHKLCHTLGGTFDLPHAETHTVVLPHVLAFNAHAIPEVIERLSQVLGDDPARALYDLAGRLGAARSLADLGMPQAGIEQATDRALANPYWNPRPLEREAVRAMLSRAWAGEAPLING